MTHVTSRIAALAVVPLLLLTASCGGDTSAPSKPDAATSPGSSGDAGSASIPDEICSAFTASDFEAIVGAPGTMEEQPGGGCEYSQEDPRAVSVSINALPVAAASDYDAARSGATGVMDHPVITDGDSPGDHSFVGVGPWLGSSSLKGAGGATNGKVIVLTTVAQAQDLPAPDITRLSTALLDLAAAKLF
jgi:hypothetical protein